MNGVVGVGIFFAPATVAARVPGFAGLLVYAGVALACVPVALCYARLGSRFDEDGGPYVWAHAAFGPAAAFGVGWVAWVSSLFSTASVVVGLVSATAEGLGATTPGARIALALALVSALSLLLATGLRLSARVWSAVTLAKLAPLALLLAVAAWRWGSLPAATPALAPVASGGALAASLTVLFALQGFEVVPVPAGQVRASGRAVPLATLAALAIGATLYLALHALCVRALPALASSATPLADAAAALGGRTLGRVVAAGTSLSALGITVGMLAMTPRYLAALGRPGALGAWLGRASAHAVPLAAVAVTWGAVSAVVAASLAWGSLARLFALSSVSVLVQYAVTAASLGRLASRGERGLGRGDRLLAPLVGVACALILAGAEPIELALVAGVLALGLVARAFANRGCA